MKYSLSLLLICQALFSYSQKHSSTIDEYRIPLIQKTSIYSYANSPQTTQNEDVKAFIEREFNVEANLVYSKSSPVAHYYLFQQSFQDRPIYSAEIKITLDLKGNVKRIDNSSVDVPKNIKINFFNEINSNLLVGHGAVSNVEKEEIVVYQNGVFKPALKAVVSFANFDYVEYVFDENETQLIKRDLNIHLEIEKDTVANVVVFNPDPMTKANIFWTNGSDYDKNDQNEAFLNPLRDTLSIELTYDSNTNEFKLENERCVISEFSSPVNPVETSTTPFFEYSRSHYGFEEVNAYYHITHTQKHLVDMGFDLVDYKIEVTLDMFAELAECENIQAVKESTRDISNLTRMKTRFGDRFKILSGVDTLALESIFMGADGWVAGLVCAFPKETVAIFNLANNGRQKAALDIYRWFLPLLELDINAKLVQNIKLAEVATGLGTENVRAPRLPLIGKERETVLKIIEDGLATRPTLPEYLNIETLQTANV